MPLSKDTLERTLSLAQSELDAWLKSLDDRGVAPADRRKNPKWRSLNARCRRLQKRLSVIRSIHARDAELARRKSEAAAE